MQTVRRQGIDLDSCVLQRLNQVRKPWKHIFVLAMTFAWPRVCCYLMGSPLSRVNNSSDPEGPADSKDSFHSSYWFSTASRCEDNFVCKRNRGGNRQCRDALRHDIRCSWHTSQNANVVFVFVIARRFESAACITNNKNVNSLVGGHRRKYMRFCAYECICVYVLAATWNDNWPTWSCIANLPSRYKMDQHSGCGCFHQLCEVVCVFISDVTI